MTWTSAVEAFQTPILRGLRIRGVAGYYFVSMDSVVRLWRQENGALKVVYSMLLPSVVSSIQSIQFIHLCFDECNSSTPTLKMIAKHSSLALLLIYHDRLTPVVTMSPLPTTKQDMSPPKSGRRLWCSLGTKVRYLPKTCSCSNIIDSFA